MITGSRAGSTLRPLSTPIPTAGTNHNRIVQLRRAQKSTSLTALASLRAIDQYTKYASALFVQRNAPKANSLAAGRIGSSLRLPRSRSSSGGALEPFRKREVPSGLPAADVEPIDETLDASDLELTDSAPDSWQWRRHQVMHGRSQMIL